MTKNYKALPAHSGIVIAKAWILKHVEIDSKLENINKNDVQKELDKFHNAINEVEVSIKESIENAKAKLGKEKSQIFEGHLMMVNDPLFLEEVETNIKDNLVSAKSAVFEYQSKYYEMFANLEDKYMKERAGDLKSVTNDVLAAILNIKKPDISKINEEVIIVAHDLTPAETVYINTKYVKGIINEIGATTSHVVILAKSLDIPTVVGLKDATKIIKDNSQIILNGTSGEIILNPDTKEINKTEEMLKKQQEHKNYLQTLINKEAITLDNHKVVVEANIGSVSDAEIAAKYGAKGVGLFRSEFLYMHADNWPSEATQLKAYKDTLKHFPNDIVIVRTLDIGGDKNLSYYEFEKELNPFLGHRAVRFCLDNPKIFKTQLTALLKASAFGKIAIMIPMISTIDEVVKVKQMINEIKKDLTKKHIKFNNQVLLGIMVEIPSTAISADVFAKHVDFFSIGTNDLIQYTFAVDRMGQKVANLYQPLNPTILRLIKNTIDASHNNKIWTAVCGSMGGQTTAIPLLLGMGLDCFSVAGSLILETKYLIRKMKYSDCKVLVEKCLTKESASEVESLVTSYLNSLK